MGKKTLILGYWLKGNWKLKYDQNGQTKLPPVVCWFPNYPVLMMRQLGCGCWIV